MAIAMTMDVPGARGGERSVIARATLDTTLQRRNPIQFAGSIAERWRDLEVRESPDVIEAFIRFAAHFIEDHADGEPTWEDAAWQ